MLTSIVSATGVYFSSFLCQTLFHIQGTELNYLFTSKIHLSLTKLTMGGEGGGW